MNDSRFARYIDFIYRRGIILLPLLVLLVAGTTIGIFRVRIDTDFAVFMPRDSEAYTSLKEMEETFGDGQQVIAMLKLEGPVRSIETVDLLLDIKERLAQVEGVSTVRGPIPERLYLDGHIVSSRELTEDQIPLVFDYITKTALIGGISEETGHASFQILFDGSASSRTTIQNMTAVLDGFSLEYLFSGQPYLEGQIFDYVLRILLLLPPVAIILILAVFRWRIGSMKATALSMFPAVTGAILTLGALGWVLGEVSLVTVVVPLFVIVMGSADGLHFTSHVLDELAEGADRREAVRKTLEAVWTPMVLTTITTMIGFLSMLLIRSDAIRVMGICAAFGILIAGLVTWLFLPILLLKVPGLKRRSSHMKDHVYLFVSRIRGPWAVILAAVIAAVSIPGIFLVRADFNMLTVYKPRTAVRKATEAINEVMGGSLPVSVLARIDGDLFDPEAAKAIMSFEQEVVSEGFAVGAFSVYDVVANMQSAMRSGTEPHYPDSSRLARLSVAMIERIQPGTSGMLIDIESGTVRSTLLLKNLNSDGLRGLLNLAEEHSTEEMTLKLAGVPFVMQEMNDQIIPQQILSLLFACVLVFVLLFITQRSLTTAAASISPILVTLLALFGVMGYGRIDLSVITGIMSGLTIGVGIDYALHYAWLFRFFQRRGTASPADVALRYVSSPILANAMGLAIGFTAMVLSPLRIHNFLAVLMWVTMLCSALLSLTLLPTLLGGSGRNQGGHGKPQSV